MACDAAIRPFLNDTELGCEVDGEHRKHVGALRDYAYPGSVTTITWDEDDRRNFHGAWPGECYEPECKLPDGHRGNHAPW